MTSESDSSEGIPDNHPIFVRSRCELCNNTVQNRIEIMTALGDYISPVCFDCVFACIRQDQVQRLVVNFYV